jgi:hypothetical protein
MESQPRPDSWQLAQLQVPNVGLWHSSTLTLASLPHAHSPTRVLSLLPRSSGINNTLGRRNGGGTQVTDEPPPHNPAVLPVLGSMRHSQLL